jgi:hypothetical protein
MPSIIQPPSSKEDPRVVVNVLVGGGHTIRVEKSRIPTLIKWNYNATNCESIFISSDKQYKVVLEEANKNLGWKVYELNNHKQEGVGKFTEYKNSDKNFCFNCYQLFQKSNILFIHPKTKEAICCHCSALVIECTYCKKMYLKEESFCLTSEKSYCPECAKNYLIRCSRCHSYFDKRSTKTKTHNEEVFCENCSAEFFKICYGCGQEFFIELLNRHRNLLFCNLCMTNLVVIKEYNFTPDKFNTQKLSWDNELYLGLELEIETNQPPEQDEYLASDILKFLKTLQLGQSFYIKHDGTVKGFELVSQPATLKYIHTNIPWFNILKWLREQNFTSYKSGNCGLHIHLNKPFFTAIDIHKLRLFFMTNNIFIYEFSKRKGYNDKYCQYENINPSNFIKDGKRQDGKYWAIRTRTDKKNTVEFRVFRGTLSYPRFIASLQFCDALSHYIKLVSIVSCQKKSSWISFIQWCVKTNMYQHFINYIKNNEELNKIEI